MKKKCPKKKPENLQKKQVIKTQIIKIIQIIIIIGAIFRLTSAKNKNGIEQLFYEIAKKIAESGKGGAGEAKGVQIDKTTKKKKKGGLC